MYNKLNLLFRGYFIFNRKTNFQKSGTCVVLPLTFASVYCGYCSLFRFLLLCIYLYHFIITTKLHMYQQPKRNTDVCLALYTWRFERRVNCSLFLQSTIGEIAVKNKFNILLHIFASKIKKKNILMFITIYTLNSFDVYWLAFLSQRYVFKLVVLLHHYHKLAYGLGSHKHVWPYCIL